MNVKKVGSKRWWFEQSDKKYETTSRTCPTKIHSRTKSKVLSLPQGYQQSVFILYNCTWFVAVNLMNFLLLTPNLFLLIVFVI